MLRNYIAAALRNMARNRLYAAINIVGLATGIATALLIGLFVRDELGYEKWIPAYERIYLLQGTGSSPANKQGPELSDLTDKKLAGLLRLAFPQIEAVTRLDADDVDIRRGEIESTERIYWADQDTFKTMPLRAIAGNAATALDRPDSIVVTRSAARKYFGRENVVGETLELNRHYPMIVTAVLDDPPSNTNFDRSFWVAGSAPFSRLMAYNASFNFGVFTVIRLAKGADPAELQKGLPNFVERQVGLIPGNYQLLALGVLPLADIHLSPVASSTLKPRGSRTLLMAVSAAGTLILLIAGINFINLMTAWAARRAMEVGVRKTSGAERMHLIFQFVGEALMYVFLSAIAAIGLAQLLSPAVQAFLGRNTFFQYWRDPAFILAVAGVAIAFGVLAGLYPAFVLSALRPARVLKSVATQGSGSAALRRLLTTLQFAVLIALVLATGIVYQQVRFAFNEGMRMNTDQTLAIKTSCQDVFRDRVRALPGVKAAGCSSTMLDSGSRGRIVFTIADGSTVGVGTGPVDAAYFDVYGLHLVAGRMLTQDDASRRRDLAVRTPPNPPSNILLNEAAVRRFGFSSPTAAVGQVLSVTADAGPATGMFTFKVTVVGVVPDFALNAVATAIQPAIYWSDTNFYDMLHVKLTGRDIPETLAAIDALWKEVGDPRPMARTFVDQHLEDLYQGITRQAEIFGIIAVIAVFVACLGVFGLAAFTAEQRTKEIGIRKAMGATSGEILRLLLWQFSQPVLWANLIAWPVSYVGMRHWLEGFAYHIDLSPWMFLAASALALVIAVATVIGHALLVARAQPVTALRYE